MLADSQTTIFYGFLVTGTSLLIAALAFEQVNAPQLRLALQRKGFNARLRRLVLEELVVSRLEEVEKEQVEGFRCRGCLWVENARRSAVTLAFCLLRRGLPAEIRQMVMEFVVDGEIGGPAMPEARSIRGFVELRRDTEQFPGRAADDRRLRWTDLFVGDPFEAPIEQCNICRDGDGPFPHNSTYQYVHSQREIRIFLANIGLCMDFATLSGPLLSPEIVLEYSYRTHDVLAALQVPSSPCHTLFTGIAANWNREPDDPECAVFQATTTSLAAHQPTISLTLIHRLVLFGLRSTDLDTPEALQDHHRELGTIGRLFAGSALKEPAWTVWTEIIET